VWPGKLISAPARWDLHGHIGSRRKYDQSQAGSSRTHLVLVSSRQQWFARAVRDLASEMLLLGALLDCGLSPVI
jgi:hypothetical protein